MKANFSGFHPKPWKDNVDLSEPEPSQEELETILDKHAEYYIRETMKFFQENGESPALSKNNSGDLEAKAAINSLTLKQVLSLIGEDDKSVIEDDVAGEWCSTCETDINGVESPNPCQCDIKNALRAELRQSAERLYG